MNTSSPTQTEQSLADGRLARRRSGIERSEHFSVEMRFKHGSFSVREVCELAGISQNKFYCDRLVGLITTFKRGRQTAISGPVAAKYLGISLEK